MLVNGPHKHASLTTGSFRPVVESLDLTPREAGAIPPVSIGMTPGALSPRTQWFIGTSVILHCVVLAAVFGFSRPDALPPVQEIAFEIVVQEAAPAAPPDAQAIVASPTAPVTAESVAAVSLSSAPATSVASPVSASPASSTVARAAPVSPAPASPASASASPVLADAAPPARSESTRSDAPVAVAEDASAGGVTVVGKMPDMRTRTATVEKTAGRAAPKLASANPVVAVERAIHLDVPTFVLSPALRARAPEKAAPLGRLAFASAAQIVIASASDASPTEMAEAAEPPTEPDQPAAQVAAEPSPVPGPVSRDVPQNAPEEAAMGPAREADVPSASSTSPAGLPPSPIRLQGADADVTGTLPPAAPDISNTVLAVAAREPGASAAPIPAMLGSAAPELVPFPPGPDEEAAAREAAARREAMARQAEAQRVRRVAEQKAAAEARARAAKEAREARDAKTAMATAATSREWRIKVARRIHEFQSYPDNVRQRGFEGTVQVSFTVDAAGAVVSKRVLKSSGDRELDQEGLDAVQRASPFPAPPPNASRTFTAPFAYRLR